MFGWLFGRRRKARPEAPKDLDRDRKDEVSTGDDVVTTEDVTTGDVRTDDVAETVGTDLDALSLTELRAEAQRLRVPRRTKMKKHELVEAIGKMREQDA